MATHRQSHPLSPCPQKGRRRGLCVTHGSLPRSRCLALYPPSQLPGSFWKARAARPRPLWPPPLGGSPQPSCPPRQLCCVVLSAGVAVTPPGRGESRGSAGSRARLGLRPSNARLCGHLAPACHPRVSDPLGVTQEALIRHCWERPWGQGCRLPAQGALPTPTRGCEAWTCGLAALGLSR